ncbi:PAP2 superfamily-domain-containing protein [Halteromyces radiatus]|uniref:PAP2 superfamily-domain-containing protein n=1 Tax=Halteromyces radiatus TaxID=101107 RepID=UPI002220338E|nr:PAP2 superfamily-domain-containing protein [Halteromyces radiatus]KAI8081739.1 PAP2 superfamily-domain-containing protein [Halteromyces radiatus]
MLFGQLCNEVVNAILKEYFQIARPSVNLGTGYGMPSSHAQFVWYFATFGILYLMNHIKLKESAWKIITYLIIVFMAVMVCLSRIYLGYHTSGQVMIGSLVGLVFGWIWYLATEAARRRGLISWLLDTSTARWLLLRDMRDIDNVLEWEYENWIQYQQNFSNKKKS